MKLFQRILFRAFCTGPGIFLLSTSQAGPNDIYVGGISQDAIFRININRGQTTFAVVPAPLAMAFDPKGNLFFGDGDSIKKVTPDGVRTSFATNVKSSKGFAFDSAGNLFASETEMDAPLLKFTPDGKRKVFASGLNRAEGLAIDAKDNLYVAYPDKHSVLKFTPDGTRTTFASGIAHARSLACDADGNIFVADVEGNTVYKITPLGVKTVVDTSDTLRPRSVALNRSNLLVSEGESVRAYVAGGASGVIASIPGGAGQLAVEPPALANISTRGVVETDTRVLIGGFIVTGREPKKVLVRALGPSLGGSGLNDELADPVLELHDSTGAVLSTNDDWPQGDNASAIPDGLRPINSAESAILATLPPGTYTAIERGKNRSTGVGLVEVYDLDLNADARIENISTLGVVGTSDNVMIGGFILAGGAGRREVLIRALGPSLERFGVPGFLPDPTLTVFDSNGMAVAANHDWRTKEAEIESTALAPTDDRESAIVARLAAGNYTAVVAGKNDQTGVGMIEIYTTH
jgi:hypothetical protein